MGRVTCPGDIVPEISVIIVNYNSGDYLQRCLSALSNQTFKAFLTIIVDNDSQDGSLQCTSDLVIPNKIIRLNSNIGFAAANNLAVQHARSPWIATLNPDAIPERDWLEKLLDAAHRNPNATMFASVQISDSDHNIIDGAGDVYSAYGLVCAVYTVNPSTDCLLKA